MIAPHGLQHYVARFMQICSNMLPKANSILGLRHRVEFAARPDTKRPHIVAVCTATTQERTRENISIWGILQCMAHPGYVRRGIGQIDLLAPSLWLKRLRPRCKSVVGNPTDDMGIRGSLLLVRVVCTIEREPASIFQRNSQSQSHHPTTMDPHPCPPTLSTTKLLSEK